MRWLNLNTTISDRPEFVGVEPLDQATWLKLCFYCAKLENGGVIEDCGDWKSRRWEQAVRVTKAEVSRRTELWTFDGKRLDVRFYPAEQEKRIKKLRGRAKAGGKASGKARRK